MNLRNRMPPGKNMDDWCTLIRSGLFSLQWKLSKEGKKRFFTEFIPLLHDTKRGALGKDDDNSWYLVYIGTKPASRGRGYAKALIEHTTRQVSFVITLQKHQLLTRSFNRPMLKIVSAILNVATPLILSYTGGLDLSSSRRFILCAVRAL